MSLHDLFSYLFWGWGGMALFIFGFYLFCRFFLAIMVALNLVKKEDLKEKQYWVDPEAWYHE
jgi:hypothetical protein